jgi:hypothetical protein
MEDDAAAARRRLQAAFPGGPWSDDEVGVLATLPANPWMGDDSGVPSVGRSLESAAPSPPPGLQPGATAQAANPDGIQIRIRLAARLASGDRSTAVQVASEMGISFQDLARWYSAWLAFSMGPASSAEPGRHHFVEWARVYDGTGDGRPQRPPPLSAWERRAYEDEVTRRRRSAEWQRSRQHTRTEAAQAARVRAAGA